MFTDPGRTDTLHRNTVTDTTQHCKKGERRAIYETKQCKIEILLAIRGVLKGLDFFFVKDRP